MLTGQLRAGPSAPQREETRASLSNAGQLDVSQKCALNLYGPSAGSNPTGSDLPSIQLRSCDPTGSLSHDRYPRGAKAALGAQTPSVMHWEKPGTILMKSSAKITRHSLESTDHVHLQIILLRRSLMYGEQQEPYAKLQEDRSGTSRRDLRSVNVPSPLRSRPSVAFSKELYNAKPRVCLQACGCSLGPATCPFKFRTAVVSVAFRRLFLAHCSACDRQARRLGFDSSSTFISTCTRAALPRGSQTQTKRKLPLHSQFHRGKGIAEAESETAGLGFAIWDCNLSVDHASREGIWYEIAEIRWTARPTPREGKGRVGAGSRRAQAEEVHGQMTGRICPPAPKRFVWSD